MALFALSIRVNAQTYTQNWSGVTVPALPSDWSAVSSTSVFFMSTTDGQYSVPNSVSAKGVSSFPGLVYTGSVFAAGGNDLGPTENMTWVTYEVSTSNAGTALMFIRNSAGAAGRLDDSASNNYRLLAGPSWGFQLQMTLACATTNVNATIGASTAFAISTWYRLEINYNNGLITCYTQRPSFLANGSTANPGGDNKWLNSSGAWVAGKVAAISATPTTIISGAGKFGLAEVNSPTTGDEVVFDDFSATVNAATATSFTLTSPGTTSGPAGVASGNFTIGPTGGLALPSSQTIALTETVGSGGIFTSGGSAVTSLSFASGATASQTFTYTPSGSAGSRTISAASTSLGTTTAGYTVTASSAATTYTVTGPTSGAAGVASSTFTLTSNGVLASGITVSVTTTNGATVTTSPVTLAAGTNTTGTFTITPGSSSTTLSFSNSGGLTNPSNQVYSVARTTPTT